MAVILKIMMCSCGLYRMYLLFIAKENKRHKQNFGMEDNQVSGNNFRNGKSLEILKYCPEFRKSGKRPKFRGISWNFRGNFRDSIGNVGQP
jgi:hypothetical protein